MAHFRKMLSNESSNIITVYERRDPPHPAKDTADYDGRKPLLSIVAAVSLAAHTRLNAIEREPGSGVKAGTAFTPYQNDQRPGRRTATLKGYLQHRYEGHTDELLCLDSTCPEVFTGTVILSQAARSHAPSSLYSSLSTWLGGAPALCIA